MSKLKLAAFHPQKSKGRVAMLTLALYFSGSLAITLLQDSISLEFGDQGRKLLIGFAVAVAIVIAFTIIKFQRRDKNPPRAFISVTSYTEEDATRKSPTD